MSVADAPGKFAALNIAVAGSVDHQADHDRRHQRLVLQPHVSLDEAPAERARCACRLIHVALSSMTLVEASRAELAAVLCPALLPVPVAPLARLVRLNPVPQHAKSRFSR